MWGFHLTWDGDTLDPTLELVGLFILSLNIVVHKMNKPSPYPPFKSKDLGQESEVGRHHLEEEDVNLIFQVWNEVVDLHFRMELMEPA